MEANVCSILACLSAARKGGCEIVVSHGAAPGERSRPRRSRPRAVKGPSVKAPSGQGPVVVAATCGQDGCVGNMARLERIVARLPEVQRVDVEAWGDEPTFRVRGKTFIFTDPNAHALSVKLSKEEAAAVVATDPLAEPTGYGLGRHGWVSVRIGNGGRDRWGQVEEWVRTSYTLVAPRALAKAVIAEDTTA